MKRVVAQSSGWAVAAACALFLAAPAQAAPIPLGLSQGEPDIAASTIAISYDAGTNAFSATGVAPLVYNPGNVNITGASYALNATIDAAGNLLAPGTLTLSGLLNGAPLSLGASLTAFGYNSSGIAVLEFLGTVTAQNNAGFVVGSTLGVIMTSQINDIGFGNTFTQSATAAVSSDNFAVPVPEAASTLSLLSLSVLGLRAARRRR